MNTVIKNMPAREVACGQCCLYTPAWRERCIHCSRPLANAPLRPPLKGDPARAVFADGRNPDNTRGERIRARHQTPVRKRRR